MGEDSGESVVAAERLQLALDAGAIIGTWVWTIPDDCFIGDERFAHTFGLEPEAVRAGLPLQVLFESIHPDDRERVSAAIGQALAKGGPYRCDYRVRRADGHYGWVVASGRVETDGQGTPLRFPGVLLDDSERRRIEAERDRANALLHTFIEAVPGVVYAKDKEGRLIVGNRGVAELLGVAPGTFVGKTDLELIADRTQAERVIANDRRIMQSGVAEQVEEEIHLADGTPATWLSTKAPLRDARGQVVGLIGASLDITDRKRMETALRLSEQRSALALDVAQLGTWTLDENTGCVEIDARTAQICGMPGPGRFDLRDLARRVHPADLAQVAAAVRGTQAPGGAGTLAIEFRLRHPGGGVAWVGCRGQASNARLGARIGPRTMIGTLLDITERRRMIEALELGDRRKDEFLAMLAHELRNPLAPIATAAQMLQLAPGDPARVKEASDIIQRQARHMTGLVDDLLDVSRVTRGLVVFAREPVDMRAVFALAMEQVAPLMQARGHALTGDPGDCEAYVIGDQQRLVQVVVNLLTNAAKYTPPGGRITVSCECTDAEVVLRVSDTGIGIEAELLPAVFDLFTQAARAPDRAQGGLGIGLAVVRTIVQAHGGTITAYSAGVGEGSLFTVVLPRTTEVPSAVPPAPLDAAEPRAMNVLIVDDNEDAAEVLGYALRLLGHDVAIANGGEQALAIARERDDWDAFILDIGMPGISGLELAQALRERMGGRPARFIALTGYGQARDLARTREAGFDHHMVKPADIDALQRLLVQPRSTSPTLSR